MRFSSREIAIAIWVALVLTCAAAKSKGFRRSTSRLFLSMLSPKLLVPFVLMAAYLGGMLFLLRSLGFWRPTIVKAAVYWFVGSGVVFASKFVTGDETGSILRKASKENLKVLLVVGFIVNTYTLHISIELALVPVGAFLFLSKAIAEHQSGLDEVAGLVEWAIVILGLSVFGWALWMALQDPSFLSLQHLEEILVVPLLSFMNVPFVYLLVLYSIYERLFLQLDFGLEKSRQLKRYAKMRLIRHVGLRLERARHIRDDRFSELMRFQSREDVDQYIDEL